MHRTITRSGGFALFLLLAAGCSKSSDSVAASGAEDLPPRQDIPAEHSVGERLFREPRFAQYFAAHSGSDVNRRLSQGDPALDLLTLGSGTVASPFAGSTQSCASCHLTDQAIGLPGGGLRAMNDFAPRVRFTERPDGARVATRNVPSLVDVTVAPRRLFFADGEYSRLDAVIEGSLLGRKLGWMADERLAAVSQVASVIRNDDGQGALAREFGGLSYTELLDLRESELPDELLLPEKYRLDVATASDEQLVDAVVALLGAYLESRSLSRNLAGELDGSPYDAFLELNELPRTPAAGETDIEYARRLRNEVDALAAPVFVEAGGDNRFVTHDQDFAFGANELEGLRSFLREPGAVGPVGNCVACHAPPRFTDDLFHNTGVSQAEYDGVHGAGRFMQLVTPTFDERNRRPGLHLPPTEAYPMAPSTNRYRANLGLPELADLGLWNVFANQSMPEPQGVIRAALTELHGAKIAGATDAELLELTEAVFRTPSLRNLGHSAPYGHDGAFADLKLMLEHYPRAAQLTRDGFMRNPDPRLADVELTPADLPALAAFLRSLNEDLE